MSRLEIAPSFWQSAFVLLAIILMLFLDATVVHRLKQFTSSTARLSVLRTTVVYWWTFTLLALALARPHDLFAVRPTGVDDMAWLLHNPAAMAVAIAVLVIYFSLAFEPGLHCAMRPEARQKYSAAVRSLLYILPVSNSERRGWVMVSLTAGVCEEVFFRGFVLQFLQGHLHGNWNMPLVSAWLMSSLAFGCCHFYQGISGIARTTLGGLAFGLLAIITGSLVMPIVMHVLVDLAVLWVYSPQQNLPATAARLMEGCSPETVNEA